MLNRYFLYYSVNLHSRIDVNVIVSFFERNHVLVALGFGWLRPDIDLSVVLIFAFGKDVYGLSDWESLFWKVPFCDGAIGYEIFDGTTRFGICLLLLARSTRFEPILRVVLVLALLPMVIMGVNLIRLILLGLILSVLLALL